MVTLNYNMYYTFDLQVLMESIVRGNLVPAVVEAILRPGPPRDAVIKHIILFQELYQQCTTLCQKKAFRSILRGLKPSELVSFSFDQLAKEWSCTAPLLFQFLTTVANVPLSKSNTVPPESLPSICAAGAVLLRQRNQHMSALHHIVGLILFHGNASKLVGYLSSHGGVPRPLRITCISTPFQLTLTVDPRPSFLHLSSIRPPSSTCSNSP